MEAKAVKHDTRVCGETFCPQYHKKYGADSAALGHCWQTVHVQGHPVQDVKLRDRLAVYLSQELHEVAVCMQHIGHVRV